MRAAGPVIEVHVPIIGKVWTTTTQDLSDQVLRDSDSFTIRREDGDVAGFRWWMPGILRSLASSMLGADNPDHRRLRNIVDEAFRRRAVVAMEPRILLLAGKVAEELFAEGSPADLVRRFARELPLSVICELLGLPLEDRPKFSAWAHRLTRPSGPIGFLRMIPDLYAMKRYMAQRLDIAHEQGGEGLIAELARVESEGGRISRDGMVSMLFLLLFAGHETTTHLISGSVRELLLGPDLRDWLREDWSSRRASNRGISALRFARAVHQTTSGAKRHGIRRHRATERRSDHADADRCQSRPPRQSAAREAEPRTEAQQAHGFRSRHSFLPRPPTRPYRGPLRAPVIIPALAETGPGGGRLADSLADTGWHAGDRSAAGGSGGLETGGRGR